MNNETNIEIEMQTVIILAFYVWGTDLFEICRNTEICRIFELYWTSNMRFFMWIGNADKKSLPWCANWRLYTWRKWFKMESASSLEQFLLFKYSDISATLSVIAFLFLFTRNEVIKKRRSGQLIYFKTTNHSVPVDMIDNSWHIGHYETEYRCTHQQDKNIKNSFACISCMNIPVPHSCQRSSSPVKRPQVLSGHGRIRQVDFLNDRIIFIPSWARRRYHSG